MSAFARVLVLVLDSAGIGELPDAARYGDEGSSTLPHAAAAMGGLRLPVLGRLGLGNIVEIAGVPPVPAPEAAWGKMAEASSGKDTTTGHWEIMGVVLSRPFPTYPRGFPPEIIGAFERAAGVRVLGNVPASGTEIIKQLGEEHMRTGRPIVYTSADSVFQIAAHEEVIPVARLYQLCRIARGLLTGEHAVSRVIARPFAGTAGNFTRTERRKDFSVPPLSPTVLDAVSAAGLPVVGVGKIEDIFAGRGLTLAVHTRDDVDGVDQTVRAVRETSRGLVFTNLVDLDMKYGHRNDVAGYARQLEMIDARLEDILEALGSADLLIITADHGNDPTTPSTDHSREYVPVLAWGRRVRPAALGLRRCFADVGATAAAALGVRWEGPGESFLAAIA
ncbi:MAG: phosphopentomutase [Armatimonadetes bacterium]|nr:phosphopentomutase [Armatimonadota bacterium]